MEPRYEPACLLEKENPTFQMNTCQSTTISLIDEAFADVPPPPKWNGISSAEARDDYRDPTPEERAKEIRMTWQKATTEDLNRCTTALSHLTPEGWHHFIPAYMRWTIQYMDDPKWRDSNLMDSVSFSLRNKKRSSADLEDYIEERHSRLDLKQLEAVMAYFQCFSEDEADFYFDQLFDDLHYWYDRYEQLGGEKAKDSLLWLFYR